MCLDGTIVSDRVEQDFRNQKRVKNRSRNHHIFNAFWGSIIDHDCLKIFRGPIKKGRIEENETTLNRYR